MPVKFVLDTHVWFWAVEKPEKFPARVLSALRPAINRPFGLSAISLWEISKLVEKQRIKLTIPLKDWMDAALNPDFIEILPLTAQVAMESTVLPGKFHYDPADQLIVASARLHEATLITSDERILAYAHVKTLWK